MDAAPTDPDTGQPPVDATATILRLAEQELVSLTNELATGYWRSHTLCRRITDAVERGAEVSSEMQMKFLAELRRATRSTLRSSAGCLQLLHAVNATSPRLDVPQPLLVALHACSDGLALLALAHDLAELQMQLEAVSTPGSVMIDLREETTQAWLAERGVHLSAELIAEGEHAAEQLAAERKSIADALRASQ